MRFLSVFIVLAILLSQSTNAAEQVFSHQPSIMPKFSLNGPNAVGVRTIEVSNTNALNLTDFKSQSTRKLTLEVWYPTNAVNNKVATYKAVTRTHKPFELEGFAFRDVKPTTKGKFPLVVLSHGYTGYRAIMYYLGEHLASHGYIVVSIDHTHSTTAEVDFKKSPFSGFTSTLINRAKDQQFVLNEVSKKSFFLEHVIDTDNSAVIGYSMGGYGAINTVGGCYDFKEQHLTRFGFPKKVAKSLLSVFNFCNAGLKKPDSRWKAMIAFAPWGQELALHQQESLAKIAVPTLYVSGDQDDISGFEHGVKKLFQQTSKQDNFLLVYENARHNVAPHPAPLVAYESDDDLGHYIEPSWNNEQLTRINEHMTLVFLNCYIKNKQKSCDYLPKRERAVQIKQADNTLTKPWPGFNDRWATGIKFYQAR